MAALPAVTRLTAALVAAGLPVQCVSDNGNGTYTVTLQSGSTTQQQTQANALVSSYVDAPRVPAPLSTIYNALLGLTTVQQNKVIAVCCALIVQQNPTLAQQVGVAFVGDQPGV